MLRERALKGVFVPRVNEAEVLQVSQPRAFDTKV
jgi:hypothetical protein